MVARGDLGVEMPIEQLPMIQKRMVKMCNESAKPVIVATQMLDSMEKSPIPTRAETTDVANAVLDGADAVMLSGETATGVHPTLVVSTMRKIVQDVEANANGTLYNLKHKPDPNSSTFVNDTVCNIVHTLALEVKAKAIVGVTVSGYTAYQISQYRPHAEIDIFSNSPFILSQLNLVWGVRPLLYRNLLNGDTDVTMQEVNDILKVRHIVDEGDIVVNTGAIPLKEHLKTNMVRASKI
jgi:pyruvate kinase